MASRGRIEMAELWKQCADWLCRLEVLPGNHRITWPDANIQDLAYTLRDGVLLCHIAATIDPISIEMVNQRPQMAQFLCLKNIKQFLTACSTFFELKETDLFQPSMLYDYTDFARVLHTLSKLSKCPKAVEKGVVGFPQHIQAPTEDEEQTYRTLEERVNEDTYEDFYYKHHGAAGAYGGGRSSRQYYMALDTEEAIYEDLCSLKSPSSRQMQKELNLQPKDKREHCIKELVETEGKYVDVLNMLRKHFVKSVTKMKDSDKRAVFINLKELGEIHASFYQEILESVTGKSKKKIGELFIDFKEKFLNYGDYCCKLPRALEILDHLISKDDGIRDEIMRCEKEANEGRFRLRDLLAVPMQRILKYHLLLNQLMHNTSQDHPDSHTINLAYDAMLDVADYINEAKRDSEKLMIIKDIQNSITDWNMPGGTDLTHYGRLRKDGELKIQRHGTNDKIKIRYVFLFDKIIMFCKATRGDHYTFKRSEKMAEFKIQDIPSRVPRLGREARWSHNFLLVHSNSSVVYTLVARTEEDKKKWIAAIGEALDNVLPYQKEKSTHNPIMNTFKTPTSCAHCKKLLKGLFFQGYLCDKCEKPMHKDCILVLTKCGTEPPSRPPRPPSMLPTSTNPRGDRFSSCSLDENIAPNGFSRQGSLTSASMCMGIVPMPPNTPPPVNPTGLVNPDYINTKTEGHNWYVGEMDRDSANARLADFPIGTFLVRCRNQNGIKVGHAISLKTLDGVKHMKIVVQEDQVYLSDSRKFRSIVELVYCYSRNSLKECFPGLDTNLRFSVGDVFLAEAQFDFKPNPTDKTLLPLCAGDRLTIVDMEGDQQGWWKAFNGSKVGFIPKDYVSKLSRNSINNGNSESENINAMERVPSGTDSDVTTNSQVLSS